MVTAGPIPPYPTELLGSTRFEELLERWKLQFDLIVIDTPPVLPVADAQALVRFTDATLLIARAGMTTRTSLQRAYKLLAPHAKDPMTPAIGVVLNAVSAGSSAYYEYYGHNQPTYYKTGAQRETTV